MKPGYIPVYRGKVKAGSRKAKLVVKKYHNPKNGEVGYRLCMKKFGGGLKDSFMCRGALRSSRSDVISKDVHVATNQSMGKKKRKAAKAASNAAILAKRREKAARRRKNQAKKRAAKKG